MNIAQSSRYCSTAATRIVTYEIRPECGNHIELHWGKRHSVNSPTLANNLIWSKTLECPLDLHSKCVCRAATVPFQNASIVYNKMYWKSIRRTILLLNKKWPHKLIIFRLLNAQHEWHWSCRRTLFYEDLRCLDKYKLLGTAKFCKDKICEILKSLFPEIFPIFFCLKCTNKKQSL